MKKIKIGLTGLGRIGKAHLKSLVYRLPETEVVAVSDISPATKAVAEQFGVSTFYQSFEEVLAHDEIEAVAICSPTATHLDYIKESAQAGKHIFCEKPLDLNIEHIKEIDNVVKAAGVKLQVGFNRRFDADFMQLKATLDSGAIGEPHILKITSRDPGPPPLEYLKGSGGLFMDMTIHDFDMARFLIGCEVEEVFAQGLVRVDPRIGEIGDIDTAIVQLKFENSVIAAIDNSRKAVYGYDQRVEVFGSGGMSKNVNHYPHSQTIYNETGGHHPRMLHFFMERYEESYFNEMKAFIEAVKEEKEVPVSSHDALMATKIALAGQLSVKENRVVRLDEF